MLELTSHSEEQTQRIAALLAAELRGGDVIALHGPLGAGKTCFVRGLAEGLGLDASEVSSPTFVICAEYGEATDETRAKLAHLDAYRLSGPEELESIGLDELLARDDVVVAVEWAERCGEALPEVCIDVVLAHVDEQVRTIRIDADSSIVDRLRGLQQAAAGGQTRCPICGTPVPPTAAQYPFCSARCRLVDLGKWMGGDYRVSRGTEQADYGEE